MVFTHFRNHPVVMKINEMTLETEFLQLIDHAMKNHPTAEIRPIQMWKILHASMKSTGRFDNIFILAELCLSAPSSNAKVERFFNYLKLVKTDWRCSLSADSLEHLLRIRVEGPDLETYSKEFVHDAVSMWWSEKQRRLVQGKRSYPKRQGKSLKRQKFDNEFIRDFLLSSDSEEGSEDEVKDK